MKTCPKCHQTFKNKDYDSESHIDQHTPYWLKGRNVRLSGADQIRIMLANWSGGWEKFISQEQKRIKQQKKDDYDLKKSLKLQKFEERNNIEFVVCGSKVESYRELDQQYKSSEVSS